MRQATLLFLIKKSGNNVTDVCLAMKKRGFGAGRWNGVGGKVKDGETIEQALLRETAEEIGVTPKEILKIAELHFTFPNNPEWDQTVHAYFSTQWQGEPTESEEMAPKWFKTEEIPYGEMWPADRFWTPKVIEGKCVTGNIVFGKGDTILEHEIHEVPGF